MKTNGKPMATKEEPKEPKSKSQRAREFKERYESLLKEAIEEQVATITAAVTELAELGSNYHVLTDEEYQALKAPQLVIAPPSPVKKAGRPPGTTAPKKTVSGPSANYEATKKCELCNIVGHDGRKHRTMKDPFTQDQLKEMGLLPPDGTPVQQSLA